MKKKFLIFLLANVFCIWGFLVPVDSKLQTLTENEIYSNDTGDNIDVYNLAYEENSGNYCFLDYNSVDDKYSLKSKDKETDEYDYVSLYDIKFDSKGNYYAFAANYFGVDSAVYFLIANGRIISSFESVETYNSFMDKNDDLIFIFKDGDGYRIGTYSLDNEFETSEKYTSIKPIYRYLDTYEFDVDLSQDNMFKDKDGNYGFIVSDNVTSSILFGDNLISTPYTDINPDSFVYDKNGEICYVAKMDGKFYEKRGREFVVQGDKSFKEFEYIYPPILFDRMNNPVYVTMDSSEIGFVSKVVIGDDYQKVYSDVSKTKKGAVYTGGIYFLNIDPENNITYYAAIEISPDNEMNEEVYANLFNVSYVTNGIEGKFYLNPGLLKMNKKGGSLISYVTDKMGNKTRLLYKKGDKEKIVSKMDFNEIPNYGFINNSNKIYYVGLFSGDWTKKIKDQYYVYINGKRIGKYESIFYQEELNDFSLIKFDKKNNYAFVIQESETEIGDENFEYYTYVVTKDGKQNPVINFNTDKKAFDYIQNLFFTKNNKLFYTAGIYNELKNTDQVQVMIDNKPLDKIYNSIDRLKYDEEKNVISFIGERSGTAYKVKIFF